MQHTSKIIIEKNIQGVFNETITIDPSLIFKDWGKYAGVKSGSEFKNWGTVGQIRKMIFNDNTETKETLSACQIPNHFAYSVTNFTDFQLKIGLNAIEGSWDFVQISETQTEVSWTYKPITKHFVARWMLKKVVKNDLPHIMAQGLNHLKLLLEAK